MLIGAGRGAVRRQGAQPEASASPAIFAGNGTDAKTHALMVAQVAGDRSHGHPHRERGAAARIQPDQVASAALQHPAARRQELSRILSVDAQNFPRLAFIAAPQRAGPLSSDRIRRRGGAREPNSAAEAVPAAPCEDSFFATARGPACSTRSSAARRPASAWSTQQSYATDVRDAVLFLEGASSELSDDLAGTHGSGCASARLRDRRRVCATRSPRCKRDAGEPVRERGADQDIDVVALVARRQSACVRVDLLRGGRNLGTTQLFPATRGLRAGESLGAFLTQYYLTREVAARDPGQSGHRGCRCCLSRRSPSRRAGAVAITSPACAACARAGWRWRVPTPSSALRMRAGERCDRSRAAGGPCEQALGLDEAAAAHRVLRHQPHAWARRRWRPAWCSDAEGPIKIATTGASTSKASQPGDDYGAMRQALTRRYSRLKRGEARLPDLLLIDGGQGQVCAGRSRCWTELGISGIALVGVAKGAERRAGRGAACSWPGRRRPLYCRRTRRPCT